MHISFNSLFFHDIIIISFLAGYSLLVPNDPFIIIFIWNLSLFLNFLIVNLFWKRNSDWAISMVFILLPHLTLSLSYYSKKAYLLVLPRSIIVGRGKEKIFLMIPQNPPQTSNLSPFWLSVFPSPFSYHQIKIHPLCDFHWVWRVCVFIMIISSYSSFCL